MKKQLLALLALSMATTAFADNAKIIAQLKKLGVEKVEVQDSPLNGLKAAVTDQGILYVCIARQFVSING